MEQKNKLKDSLISFLRNLFDLMILNWLWLLCCLPVVTIGPATCGLYNVTLKLARGEPVYPAKDFFRGMKANFRHGVILSLLAAVLLAAVAGDLWLAFRLTGAFRTVYLVVAMMVGVILLIVLAYAFALQAMFSAPLKTHMTNAFKLAVVAPAKTVFLWIILTLPVTAVLLLPPVAVEMLGFLYIVVGISGPVYGASRILRDVFDRVNGTSAAE